MNTKRNITWIFIFLLFLFSCNNGALPIYFENKATDEINIDILVPGDTGLKYNIFSLGLLQIKYTPTNQKIIEKYEEEEKNITIEHIYDAIQSNYDGFFSEAEAKTDIEILEITESIAPQDSFNWENLKAIADHYNFDALFYINNLKISFDIKTEIPNDGSSSGYHNSSLKCVSTFYYTILYPKKKEFETLVSAFSDSFNEDSYFSGSKPAYLHSSKKINEALPYLCYETGKRAVYEFFPVWLTVKRKYYGRATKELREAKKYVNKGMWEGAINIWEDNKNNDNKVLAKHCQYNLILAEELTGSLEKAIQLTEVFYHKYREDIALEYRIILEKRLMQKEKLEKYIPK